MQEKNNNHHTLFITLIIAYFVLLIVALAKIHSYGAELGFDESEVSGNEEIYEEITESPEEDSETGIEISFTETDEDIIPSDEIILEESEESILLESKLGTRGLVETEHTVNASVKNGYRIASGAIGVHSGDNLYYVYLSPNVEYTISTSSGLYTARSLNKGSAATSYSGRTITPTENIYLIKENSSFSVTYISVEEIDDPEPSGNDPDPSGNDPSGNDPSGNNPSGGGIELDGDLQEYLINYFGHKDYTVYDSEETFKGKKFFVSRYEYEVLKSLDDIKILLLCNVGILIVILFVGRRKRNAGS